MISRRALFGWVLTVVAAVKAKTVAATPTDNALVYGNAAKQYAAAVRAGTLAQHSSIISCGMNHLRRVYRTDPEAFTVAADAWKSAYVGQHGGGEVGQAVEWMIDEALK